MVDFTLSVLNNVNVYISHSVILQKTEDYNAVLFLDRRALLQKSYFLKPLCISFTLMFRVLLNLPTASKLHLVDSQPVNIPQVILINLGIHFPLDTFKLCRPWGSKTAPNHYVPSQLGRGFHVGMWVLFYAMHSAACKSSPQYIFPVVLWSVRVLFGKLQVQLTAYSPVFCFGHHVLHTVDTWREMLL